MESPQNTFLPYVGHRTEFSHSRSNVAGISRVSQDFQQNWEPLRAPIGLRAWLFIVPNIIIRLFRTKKMQIVLCQTASTYVGSHKSFVTARSRPLRCGASLTPHNTWVTMPNLINVRQPVGAEICWRNWTRSVPTFQVTKGRKK